MEELLKFIEQADDGQLRQIMTAISERYRTRFPDWEVIYMAAPAIAPEQKERFHTAALSLLAQYAP